MIDVACEVAARAAIDRPLGIYAEEILAVTLIDFFIRDAWPGVLDSSFTFGDRLQSKQSQTGGSAPDFVFSIPVIFTQGSKFPLLCPINFSLSRSHDKLKLIGHLPAPR